MIALRTFGADNNGTSTPAGPPCFCAIPVPVGVRDGDLILVGLSLPAGGGAITPPSEEWGLIARTNRGARGLAVYQHRALNEPARWVFELDATGAVIEGGCLVYAGTEPFDPIEAVAFATTPSGTTHAVPSVATSLDGCELALFLGADTAGTFTLPAGYLAQVTRSQTSGVFTAARTSRVAAGGMPATSATFSSGTSGAAILVALRPGLETLTVEDVRRRIVDALPSGMDGWADFTPGGDYYLYFQAVAEALQVYGFYLLDLLRSELSAARARYLLPAWEAIFGLETSSIAQRGSIPQRQGQVISGWRSAVGSSTRDSVRTIVAPLLGYANPEDLEIVETSRDALSAVTVTDLGSLVFVPAGLGDTITLGPALVRDRGYVSAAGVMVTFRGLATDGISLDAILVTLTGPGGTIIDEQPLGASSQVETGRDVVIRAKVPAGTPIYGEWTLVLALYEETGETGITASAVELLVEGIGRDQWGNDGLAAAMYRWAVLASPDLVGATHPADFAAARRAIDGVAQSHTIGGLALRMSDGSSGAISSDTYAISGGCLSAEAMIQTRQVTLNGSVTSMAVTWSAVLNPRVSGNLTVTDGGGGTSYWWTSRTSSGGTINFGAAVTGYFDVIIVS